MDAHEADDAEGQIHRHHGESPHRWLPDVLVVILLDVVRREAESEGGDHEGQHGDADLEDRHQLRNDERKRLLRLM